MRALGLLQNHRQALDELVVAGDLDQAVAAQVQVAFVAAAYHVWRSNAPITCYEPVMVDYAPVTSAQLGQQAAILAQGKDLEPNTVVQMQAAIARDIAFLTLTDTDRQELYSRLIQASRRANPFRSLTNWSWKSLPTPCMPHSSWSSCCGTERPK